MKMQKPETYPLAAAGLHDLRQDARFRRHEPPRWPPKRPVILTVVMAANGNVAEAFSITEFGFIGRK